MVGGGLEVRMNRGAMGVLLGDVGEEGIVFHR